MLQNNFTIKLQGELVNVKILEHKAILDFLIISDADVLLGYHTIAGTFP